MDPATLEQTQATNVTALLDEIALVGEAFSQKKAGAREHLISNARRLIAALETPVEAVTWIAWAEVKILDPRILDVAEPSCASRLGILLRG